MSKSLKSVFGLGSSIPGEAVVYPSFLGVSTGLLSFLSTSKSATASLAIGDKASSNFLFLESSLLWFKKTIK